MAIFINLLPYLNRIDDCKELLDSWQGGLEISMDGPNWVDPMNWTVEFSRFQQHRGPLSVHSPIWELNLASARYEVLRNYSFDVYKQSLAWSAKIGAEQVVVHPSLYSSPLFLRSQSQYYAKENLKRLGEEAKKLGIDMAVENVGFHETALFNEEEFVRLFEEIPTISALVDVGHSHINGWDTASLICQLGTRLSAVHLHDNDAISDLHLPIGAGTLEWGGIWDALRSADHPFRSILEYGYDTPMELLLQHVKLVEHELEEPQVL
ncbi:sugar phosphate isomerase/epimerase family protein [Paenibacillus agricola]|uniref:Sugar phosphate isomerase/epimerase n=1 Tax=Paenibacillus agricola TaxID=2716264 RepID=A0ABX0J3G1_9BACL|nr:sugar phosphate isomerase/epimerase [Paenibacillus agricola]NHN29950.1 sugar phosphate isomerase/epimerase [Paenibacillus agricola]